MNIIKNNQTQTKPGTDSSFSFSNIKKNFEKIQYDPYSQAKFNYLIAKWFAFGLIGIIGFQFIMLIINFSGGSSTGINLLGRAFMLLVGVILISTIWMRFVLPLKKTLNHYDNSPSKIDPGYINVGAEIEQIISSFDNKKYNKMKGGNK